MHKLIVLIFILLSSIFLSSNVFANSAGVVIKSVQPGDIAGVSNEFIQIYNNGDNEIDVTNWCLYYASSTNNSNGAKISCLTSDNPNIHIFLPGHTNILAVSDQYFQSSGVAGDMRFDAILSAKSGHVRIIDDKGVEIDKIAWGVSAISPEGSAPAAVPKSNQIMSRKYISDLVLKDSDSNIDDFEVIELLDALIFGQINEVQDICSNIPEIQPILPDGYSVDVLSNCTQDQIDVCRNIDGLQSVIPDNYGYDESGDCVADVCLNLDLIQTTIPLGYRLNENKCILDLLKIEISEMLPNPLGTDAGSEFIELYNPNDVEVSLNNYALVIGSDRKIINFPIDSVIGAKEIKSFLDNEMLFNLVNSIGGVSLESADGQIIDGFVGYEAAGDDMSWAKIDGLWQYTNRPTSGSINLVSMINETEVISENETLQSCAPNQYRSPETNRCRLIPITTSSIVPCGTGQYRSEETNRCRNIASDIISLVPCAEGQDRNPETNRCRNTSGSVLGSSDLKPCKEGQERNPETNRCRNIKGDIAEAQYKPQQAAQKQDNMILILSIAGVVSLALGYGIWEWKSDIVKLFSKIREKLSK